MEIKSPLQIASDKLIAWASLVWHCKTTCFPALEWHWELLKIIFPSSRYPFWKTGSNRTNWNSIAIARSYIPAGKSISGADVEWIIYHTFIATIFLPMPLSQTCCHLSWISDFAVLQVTLCHWPAPYHYSPCPCFCHLWLLPTVIFSFLGRNIENIAYFGRSLLEIVSLMIISYLQLFFVI